MSIDKSKLEKFNIELNQLRNRLDSSDMQTIATINKMNTILRDFNAKKINRNAVIDQLLLVKDLFDDDEIVVDLMNDLSNDEDNSINLKDKERQTVEDIEKITNLFNLATKTEEKKEYELSKKYLKEILLIDPSNNSAQHLLIGIESKLEKINKEKKLKQYVYEIEITEDIIDLRKLTEKLEKELASEPDNLRLKELAKNVRVKFDLKRKNQKSLTTADAFEEYEIISQAVEEINLAIGRAEQNWYDDRSDTIRPIHDVAQEVAEELPVLAKNLFDKLYQRAKNYLPENPFEAIENLNKAIELNGLDANSKEKAEDSLIIAKKDLKKWKDAQALIEKSDAEINVYIKMQLLNQAKSTYLYFPKIEEKFLAVRDTLDSMLRGELQIAIVQSKSDFINNNFTIGRNRIDEVIKKIDEFLIDSKSEELEYLLQKAEDLKSESLKNEKRENEVNILVEEIEKALNSGDTDLAKRLFDNNTELQTESKIQNLRIQFEYKFSIEEKIKNAKQLFNNKKFEDCLQSCELISVRGDEEKELERLKNDSKFEILLNNIEKSVEKSLYDDIIIAFENINLLKLNEKQKERIQKYAALNDELDARVEENKKIVHLEKQFAKYANINDLKNSILILEKIIKYETTKIGHYRDLLNEKGGELHDQYLRNLKKLLFKDESSKKNDIKPDVYAEAFELVDFLNKHNLMISDEIREIREIVILKHYQNVTEKLEELNDWEKIEENWKEAELEFPDVLEIRAEYKKAKRKNLLFQCDRKLERFNYLEVIEDINNTELLQNKDENLREKKFIAETMKTADEMLFREEFAEMIEFIDKEISKNNHSFLISYKRDRVKDKVVELIEKGDESTDKGNLSEAISNYASALALDEENISAQSKISARLIDVRLQLDKLLKKIESFKILTSDVVENKISEVKDFQKSLKIYNKITSFIDDENDDRYQRRIKINLDDIGEILSELEDAKYILDRYDENKSTWKTLIKNGVWVQLISDLKKLENILGANHVQFINLNEQKNIAVSERRDLKEALERLDQAYGMENFGLAKNEINFIIKKNAMISNRNEKNNNFKDDDLYGLIEEKAYVYDAEKGTSIKGLENIKEHVEQLNNNLIFWEDWVSIIDDDYDWAMKEINSIKNELEEDEGILLADIIISKPQKSIINKIYEVQDEIGRKVDKNSEFPTEFTYSEKSILEKEKGIGILNTLKEMKNDIDKMINNYEKSNYYVDLTTLINNAERYINEGSYLEAIELLDLGLSFDPQNDYLNYLYEISFDKSNNSKFLGIFKKK